MSELLGGAFPGHCLPNASVQGTLKNCSRLKQEPGRTQESGAGVFSSEAASVCLEVLGLSRFSYRVRKESSYLELILLKSQNLFENLRN